MLLFIQARDIQPDDTILDVPELEYNRIGPPLDWEVKRVDPLKYGQYMRIHFVHEKLPALIGKDIWLLIETGDDD